jgi:tripartite-type tricarboxylate transporter receptor subunit TctC
MKRLVVLALSIFAFASAMMPSTATAQTWPSRPIRILVGFAPGGGTDLVARSIAPRMSEVLGTPVVVENRPGASGTIAADIAAKSSADGYTLLMGHSNSNAIAPFVLPSVPYDPVADFTPITYIGYVPNVLALNPDVPAKTVAELVALAKSKPGHYTYASSGIGSTQHLAGALFCKLTDTQINHIPYKGSGQAIGDLVSGQVSMNFDTMPPVLEFIKAGKLRALAISTPKRLSQLADVPTFEEVGIRGFDVTNWYSIMGPKNLPKDIVTKVNDAVHRRHLPRRRFGRSSKRKVCNSARRRQPDRLRGFIWGPELTKYRSFVKEAHTK